MSGMVTIMGNGKSKEKEMISLANRLKFRGIHLSSKHSGKFHSMGVLQNYKEDEESGTPVALDGYLVVLEEEVLKGPAGEEKFYALYKEYGLSLLKSLEGEFTLALQDDNGDCLIVRDPLGVKPLYFTFHDDKLYTASEIKALLDIGGTINEVPPGSYSMNGKGWISYYEEPSEAGEAPGLSLSDAKEKLHTYLLKSVEEKTAAENRLGVYLSGGLDSSVIASLAAEISPEPISTFTVGIEGSEDIKYARQIAERIGSRHHEYIYNVEEMQKILDAVIFHLESFDCAYVRSSIPNFIAARKARENGREVMLTGEGADELFAGYSYLKEILSEEEINREISRFIKGLSNTGLQRVDRMNSAHGMECRVPFLKPCLVELAMKLPLQWKLKRFPDTPVDKWILRSVFEDLLGKEVAWRSKQQFDQGSGSADLLKQIAEKEISDHEFQRESTEASVPVRNKEELYYYRIFRQFFPADVLHLVGRWEKTS